MLEWTGTVTNGRLAPGLARSFSAALLGLEGKRVRVSLQLVQRRRSNNQNRYLWGVVIPRVTAVFRDAGNMVDDEDVHAFLKEHVGKLAQVIVSPAGEVFRAPGSTKKLSTREMELYLEKVRAWAAATLGLQIPLPHEELE